MNLGHGVFVRTNCLLRQVSNMFNKFFINSSVVITLFTENFHIQYFKHKIRLHLFWRKKFSKSKLFVNSPDKNPVNFKIDKTFCLRIKKPIQYLIFTNVFFNVQGVSNLRHNISTVVIKKYGVNKFQIKALSNCKI